MKYLHNFINKEEKKSFINDLGLLKRPAVISYDNTQDVDFYDECLVKFKHVIPEDAETTASIDGQNTYKILSDGFIYESFKVNGVEMAKPLSDIITSQTLPIYVEEQRVINMDLDNPMLLLSTQDMTYVFENDFDVENGYVYIVAKSDKKYFIAGGHISDFLQAENCPIKEINNRQVTFKKFFLLAIQGGTDEVIEEMEEVLLSNKDFLFLYEEGYKPFISYTVYFSNNQINHPSLDPNQGSFYSYSLVKDIFNDNYIPISANYFYEGYNYPNIITNEVSCKHDVILRFDTPLTSNTRLFFGAIEVSLEEFIKIGGVLSDDLMSIQLSIDMLDLIINSDFQNLIFYTKNDNNVITPLFYKIEYRKGGVPTNIITDLTPATYNIVATIDSIFYKEEEDYVGYIVTPSFPKKYYILGDSGFDVNRYIYPYCVELTLPDNITYIPSSYASNCTHLKTVVLGKNIRSIDDYAFDGCISLDSITIPNSVTSIGYCAFQGCSSLSSITCLATTAPTFASYVFRYVASSGVLRVPSGSDYSSWINELPSGWVIEYI